MSTHRTLLIALGGTLFAVTAVAALRVDTTLASQPAAPRQPPEATAAPELAIPLPETGNAHAAEAPHESRLRANAADAHADDTLAALGLGDRTRQPLRIEVDGPEPWIADTPVAVVWELDRERYPLQNVLRADHDGVAQAHFVVPETRPQWFYADLAFPTLGLAATPIPPDGGTVTLSMVMPAALEIEVVEADGTPPSEPVLAYVRVPSARAPGDRWHNVAMREGRGEIAVEVGVALQAQVRTASGRTAHTELLSPSIPEESTACRLVLPSGGALHTLLSDTTGRPLAGAAVQLFDRASNRPILTTAIETDDEGVLRYRLPHRYSGGFALELAMIATVAERECFADLQLDHGLLDSGGRTADLVLQPVPQLLGGRTVNDADEPQSGIELLLEFARSESGPKDDGRLEWLPLCRATSQDDGSFVFAGLPMRRAEAFRMRQPQDPEEAAVIVESGRFDHSFRVRRRPEGLLERRLQKLIDGARR